MTRRSIQPAAIEASALQASRRMVARGERPAYRLRMVQDGRWTVSEAPWLSLDATDRREALAEAIQAISEWLDCDPAAFDIAVD
jgi:hypothetical protein